MRAKELISAVSILTGTVIGVGIFGVPFTFIKSGFLAGLLMLGITFSITLLLNLAFGEVVLRTEGSHQLTGYAEAYLGVNWKRVILFTYTLGIYSALLIYTIISGEFLATLLSVTPYILSPEKLSLVFFAMGSLAILAGIKRISWLEIFTVGMLLLTIGGLIFISIPKIDLSGIPLFRLEFLFLPYGILLFALRGSPAIPMQREILEGKEKYLKKAIIWGTTLPAIMYLIFAFVVAGVSGEATSPEVVTGLIPFLGFPILFIISLFGVLAIGTSFFGLGTALHESFHYDFHIPKGLAWFLVIFPPFLLFVFGIRDFINVMNLAGSVAIGLESIIFIMIYRRIKKSGQRSPEYSLDFSNWIWYLVLGLLIVGVAYTLMG